MTGKTEEGNEKNGNDGTEIPKLHRRNTERSQNDSILGTIRSYTEWYHAETECFLPEKDFCYRLTEAEQKSRKQIMNRSNMEREEQL